MTLKVGDTVRDGSDNEYTVMELASREIPTPLFNEQGARLMTTEFIPAKMQNAEGELFEIYDWNEGGIKVFGQMAEPSEE